MGGARSLSVAKPGGIDLTPLMRERSLTWAERGLPDLVGGAKSSESEPEEESESMNRRFLGTRGGLVSDNRRRWLTKSWTLNRLVETKQVSLARWYRFLEGCRTEGISKTAAAEGKEHLTS